MAASPTAQGIALRILAGLLLAGMFACVKAMSQDVPLGQIVFFRSVFALIPLLGWLWLRGELPHALQTRRPMGHLLRSGFGAAAMFLSFAALARLSVAEATLLSYLSPLFLTLLAWAWLNERLTLSRMAGLGLGLAGVLVLTLPDITGDWDIRRLTGIGFGLAGGVLTALALLQIRRLTMTETTGAIAVYFALVSAAGGLVTAPLGWMMPAPETAVLLVAAGLFGGFAHLAITVSLRLAEASATAPFEYLTLIWAVLTDLVLFGTPIGPAFLLSLPLLLTGAAIAAPRRKP